ncbi:MAG: hypothetical protein IJ109_02280 [Firmicutes bacterium]|nr:hypothetical protein [Bacillota bacterium]
MLKKLAACIMVMAIAVAFMPTSAFAGSKTVKMTASNKVVINGDYAYCAGASGIYKVKVKKGKATSIKRLVKNNEVFGAYSYYDAMKKKGKYLYYREGGEGTVGYINRVNVSSGKQKSLAMIGFQGDYVIKGKKIYYYKYDEESDNPPKREMKLNGKNKKKSSKKAVLKTRTSNEPGYTVKIREKGDYVRDYLETPKGTYYLGKAKIW